ncbi:hypothetical protein DUNSADRAFT_14728 [Dunaliella salina]|uniref:Encoded protein n=1 Tax=Dunaliella salina TaxID=3046 RepID=A0ABQ7H2E2_DUNSA|nr:hypothetical protein DUNSADRAFT_14728 [Dunaliella salina]|eukprot:KAF5841021.1 hypothetical protein DUNSADRAFT_14728 [Dunaliella salina]
MSKLRSLNQMVLAISPMRRRRDLAIILLHSGEPGPARAELRTYMATPHFKNAADPFDKALCYKLMDLLRSLGDGIQEPRQVVSIESALAAKAPEVVQSVKRPLTW